MSVFKEFGVEDIYGVDGEWINMKMLKIPEERFSKIDLREPFRLERYFDLVMSLEVAKHLPIECAGYFVDSLVSLGQVILFSAAVPFQGGDEHINEQWPYFLDQIFPREKIYCY